jgi:hypothetical protein
LTRQKLEIAIELYVNILFMELVLPIFINSLKKFCGYSDCLKYMQHVSLKYLKVYDSEKILDYL